MLAASGIASTALATFQNRKGNSIQTDRPMLKAALSRLSDCWPRALRFEDLLLASADDRDSEEIASELSVLLLSCYAAGVVELHPWAPPLVVEISERPIASPLVRYQCHHGKKLTTLWHRAVDLDTDLARHLVVLLDGTRNLPALAEALTALVQSGRTTLVDDGKCITEAELVRGKIEEKLPVMLKALARSALLVG
jgi:methyltransferase-like protein